MIYRLFTAAIIGLGCGTAHADETAQLRIIAGFGANFGGPERTEAYFEAGSSLVLHDETRASGEHLLGVSGLFYSTNLGVAPLLFGQHLAPQTPKTAATGDESSVPWGWIGAGALAVAGMALAGGSGDDTAPAEDGPTDENTCVYGGTENPDVDTSCVDGP